jgi:hypothetical protein
MSASWLVWKISKSSVISEFTIKDKLVKYNQINFDRWIYQMKQFGKIYQIVTKLKMENLPIATLPNQFEFTKWNDLVKFIERWATSHNVTIKHYHAYNGRFAENLFMAHVAKIGQIISFCGVKAHFQNGRAERRIRTLQDLARTQLLHAKERWPIAITEHLWPYAIANGMATYNDLPKTGQEKARIEMFSNTNIRPNIKMHHHHGVPTYVLDSDMQGGKRFPSGCQEQELAFTLESIWDVQEVYT